MSVKRGSATVTVKRMDELNLGDRILMTDDFITPDFEGEARVVTVHALELEGNDDVCVKIWERGCPEFSSSVGNEVILLNFV